MTRMQMVGEIRDLIDDLWDADRFEVVKEIMGDLDRFDFSGVPDATIARVWQELVSAASRAG